MPVLNNLARTVQILQIILLYYVQEEGVHILILLYTGACIKIFGHTFGVDLGSELVKHELKHKNIKASSHNINHDYRLLVTSRVH